jgi:hypothetical protein
MKGGWDHSGWRVRGAEGELMETMAWRRGEGSQESEGRETDIPQPRQAEWRERRQSSPNRG